MFRMRPRLLMTERSRSGCWCRWCRLCRWGRAPGSRCSPQSGGSGGHNPDQAANIHNKREREREWHKYCRFLLNIQQKAIFIGWIPGMAANSWGSDTRSRWGWRRGWSGWWLSCPWWRQTLGLCQDHSRGRMTWGWWSGGWSGSWWWPLTLRLHKFTFNPGLRKPFL